MRAVLYCANFEPVHCLNLKTLRPGGLAEYVCLSSELVPGIFELPANVGYAEEPIRRHSPA